MAWIIPTEAFEIPNIIMGPLPSTSFAIEARLVSPSASEFVLRRVSLPPHVHADQPLEVELDVIGLSAGADAIASWISTHARLQIAIDIPGQPQGEVPVLVTARPSGGGYFIRALARPSVWADAASVTVVSISLAGQLITPHCLPAKLRVGYNHAPTTAPAGAILAAATAGDVPALQAGLDAGGSTEEADTVRKAGRGAHG